MSFTVTATEIQKYQLYILATTEEKGKNKATYSQIYISHINIKQIPFLVLYCPPMQSVVSVTSVTICKVLGLKGRTMSL